MKVLSEQQLPLDHNDEFTMSGLYVRPNWLKRPKGVTVIPECFNGESSVGGQIYRALDSH